MGIPRLPDPQDLTTRPVKRGDETESEFRSRELAWRTSQSGVGSGTAGGVGIPAPSFGSIGAQGARLGDFDLTATATLPAPSRMGASAGFDPYAPDVRRIDDVALDTPAMDAQADPSAPWTDPGIPALQAARPITLMPRRFGPVGGVVPGLREARDPTPEELERTRVLAATGFDTAWGAPPGGGAGLTWDPARYLYVPDRSKESLAYATQARDGYFLQPYRDAAGTWRTRWTYAAVPTPDSARPYRVVDGPTAGGLWLTASQMSYVDPSMARIKSGEFREDPNAVFVPKYGAPPPQFRLSDYAWVGQRQLPVGCPYPYPVLPVPIADYTSGRWLDEDYVPSIPLPLPYDQTPWQCGVAKQPGKPHKKGEPPAPMTVEKVEKTPDPTHLVTADASLGIPPPTGTAAPKAGGPGEKIAAIQTKLESVQAAQKALETKLATEQDSAKRAALQSDIDALKAEGFKLANDLDDATQEQSRATGGDRYARSDTNTIAGPRVPPGLPAKAKDPDPPPVPAPRDPGTPPKSDDRAKTPCRALIVILMSGTDTTADGLSENAEYSKAEKALTSSVNARINFYREQGCEVTVEYYKDANRFLCDWAKKTLRGKVEGPFLNIEIYSHGDIGTGGPITQAEAGVNIVDTFRDIGTLLRGAMTSGRDGQGYILAGWCESCVSGRHGGNVAAALAGSSGHEVIGPIRAIEFSESVGGTPRSKGFLQAFPRIDPSEAYVQLTRESDREAPVATFLSGRDAKGAPGAFENSGWVSYPAEIVDAGGRTVANPGDHDSAYSVIRRPSLKSAQSARDGSIPSEGIEYGSLPFNPLQGSGGYLSNKEFRTADDPLNNRTYVAASLAALRGPRRPVTPKGPSRIDVDAVARAALSSACKR